MGNHAEFHVYAPHYCWISNIRCHLLTLPAHCCLPDLVTLQTATALFHPTGQALWPEPHHATPPDLTHRLESTPHATYSRPLFWRSSHPSAVLPVMFPALRHMPGGAAALQLAALSQSTNLPVSLASSSLTHCPLTCYPTYASLGTPKMCQFEKTSRRGRQGLGQGWRQPLPSARWCQPGKDGRLRLCSTRTLRRSLLLTDSLRSAPEAALHQLRKSCRASVADERQHALAKALKRLRKGRIYIL